MYVDACDLRSLSCPSQLQQENQRLREALETGKPRAARDASQAVVDDASVALMNIRKTLADCGPVFQSAGAASKLVTLQVCSCRNGFSALAVLA